MTPIRRTCALWGLLSAALLFTACGGDSQPAGDEPSDACSTDDCLDASGATDSEVDGDDGEIDSGAPDGDDTVDEADDRAVDLAPDGDRQVFGGPCFDNRDCESRMCIDTIDGGVCTELCISDCPEGFECRLISNFGADIVQVCVPERPVLCKPCRRDRDCGVGNYCLEQDNGTFCGTDCSVSRECPEHFWCNAVVIEGAAPGGADLETFVCEPIVAECLDCYCELPRTESWLCLDDGGCEPDECEPGWAHCDDDNENGCETQLGTDTSCGTTCGALVNCTTLPGVESAHCEEGECVIDACQDGLHDCNAAPGCESNFDDRVSCGTNCSNIVNCRLLPQVTDALCEEGVCEVNRCLSGFGNCDDESDDGCETDFSDPSSCGNDCDSAINCNLLPHVALADCSEQLCEIVTCEEGWGDCNSGALPGVLDGCETNLNQSETCGDTCGTAIDCGDLPGVTDSACLEGTCLINDCFPGRDDCNSDRPGGVLDGCELILLADDTCGTSCADAVVCSDQPHVVSGVCRAGDCLDFVCEDGWGDCTDAPGCETSLNQPDFCGSTCGDAVDCDEVEGVLAGNCVAGECTVLACLEGFGDCDLEADGCETDLTEITSCGLSCPARTDCTELDNTTDQTCDEGDCAFECVEGWLDCTVFPGCETASDLTTSCGDSCGGLVDCESLANTSDHTCDDGGCGFDCTEGWLDCNVLSGCETPNDLDVSCGLTCEGLGNCTTLPHTVDESCSAGVCDYSCEEGWDDCTEASGCETNLNAINSCGPSCESRVDCTSLPGIASSGCSSGACIISECADGFADCDDGAGCERALNASEAPVCAEATFLGSLSGDQLASTPLTTTGFGEGWFYFTLTEDWFADCNLSTTISLDVPLDLDYDLFVRPGGCDIPEGEYMSSSEPLGVDESVTALFSDGGGDNSLDIYFEVNFRGGSTLGCGTWGVTVEGYTLVDCSFACDGWPACEF